MSFDKYVLKKNSSQQNSPKERGISGIWHVLVYAIIRLFVYLEFLKYTKVCSSRQHLSFEQLLPLVFCYFMDTRHMSVFQMYGDLWWFQAKAQLRYDYANLQLKINTNFGPSITIPLVRAEQVP